MRHKKLITTAIAGSFFLGIIFSGPIKDTRKYFHYETAKGFYEKPYNLKIKNRKDIQGKIETYIHDTETKQYHKIGPKMYVGDYEHRIKSAGNIIIEIAEGKLKFLSGIYSLIFDDN
ncbi:MAG: hypothetical protein ISS23_02610 [Nanoarchaeota archaeon]|nr:hypothetical protein [Nanoarchaeota archaeon]